MSAETTSSSFAVSSLDIAQWVASGRIVDLVLVVMAIEAIVLIGLWRRTGRGVAPVDLLANLAAGACLLGALRSALVGAGEVWVGGFLVLAFVAHIADLTRRWPR